MTLSRRHFLLSTAVAALPRFAFAQAATEKRFIFIIQRGAADGLHTVIPYADPAYARLRAGLAVDAGLAHKLDGSFALHPALSGLADIYRAGQACVFHAVASPYRDRSHFDGQNVLETGSQAPYAIKDGWMNRLVAMRPGLGKSAIAFAVTVPLALRGQVDVTSYAPSALPQVNDDLMMRVEQLYANDAQLHALWSTARQARDMAGITGGKDKQTSADLGKMAGGFLARADGPRIAMIETTGWDTHSAQADRLGAQLGNLDKLIAGLREGLGAAWDQTVILVATEFGRTVAVNGTAGTDHGTGAVAMLIGGAVQGGRIIADWPGLAPADLLDQRDLRPTLALDALIAQTCAEVFATEPDLMVRTLFPGSGKSAALPRLLRV